MIKYLHATWKDYTYIRTRLEAEPSAETKTILSELGFTEDDWAGATEIRIVVLSGYDKSTLDQERIKQ